MIPQRGGLAVFAPAEIQKSVAERIATFEKSAELLERIDLASSDPQRVYEAVQHFLRHQRSQRPAKSAEIPIKIAIDSQLKQLLVYGPESRIEVVKTFVLGFNQADKVRREKVAAVNTGQNRKPFSADSRDTRTRNRPNDRPERPELQLPSGPVRIVHVKGADLLLIRGARGRTESGTSE